MPIRSAFPTSVLLAAILSAGVAAASPAGGDPPADEVIGLRSFNIRYDNPRDGANRWDRRRDVVLETIREHDPDFIGLQEALPHQRAWLDRALATGEPAWASIGRARERGMTSGEANPLLHRVDRWQRLDGGTFWLSETPTRIGSRSWGAACPRIATWGVYRRWSPQREPSPESFSLLVVNTHLDHASEEARRRGAATIAEFIEARRSEDPNLPVVVMGDFNTAPDGAAVGNLLAAGLVDVHRAAGGDETLGTVNAFEGPHAARGRPRIDLILADERFEVLDAGVEPAERNGRLVSDHHPVQARLRPRPATPDSTRPSALEPDPEGTSRPEADSDDGGPPRAETPAETPAETRPSTGEDAPSE